MDQGPQHKTRYTEPDRRESEEQHFEFISIEKGFLSRTPLAQALR